MAWSIIMKMVKFKNTRGQTIEIKNGREKGVINIRHSKIHPTRFGRYYEYLDQLRTPRFAHLTAGLNLDHPNIRATLEKSGAGFMLLSSKLHSLTAKEVTQIRNAVKQLG